MDIYEKILQDTCSIVADVTVDKWITKCKCLIECRSTRLEWHCHHRWPWRHKWHPVKHDYIWTLSSIFLVMSPRMTTETAHETFAKTSFKISVKTSSCFFNVITDILGMSLQTWWRYWRLIYSDVSSDVNLNIEWRVRWVDVELCLPCGWRAVNYKIYNTSTSVLPLKTSQNHCFF